VNYNVTVVITMVEAGNQELRSGRPGLAWTDSGNNYEYTLDITWLVPPGYEETVEEVEEEELIQKLWI
jgi:hypothetical protein